MNKIKSVSFKGQNTVIKFQDIDQPRGINDVVTKKNVEESDLIRHMDFVRAMDRFAPHLAIRYGFADTMDRTDFPIDKKWFDDFAWGSDPRFDGIEMRGIIIQGKDAEDGIQLVGVKIMDDGAELPLKTDAISLNEDPEGFNYPLRKILFAQLETFITEAQEFRKGKTGAAKQTEMEFDGAKLGSGTPPRQSLKAVEA